MNDIIRIIYSFRFKDSSIRNFNLHLNRQSLDFIPEGLAEPPYWTETGYHQCPDCTADPEEHKYCPMALNIAYVAHVFRDFFSYEGVEVTVTTEERTYQKKTTLQEGLTSLIGLIMATSRCPVMEYLKPMARFHLPFATPSETVTRMISTYLLAQYFLIKDNKVQELNLEGMEKIYSSVSNVNMYFTQRLTEASRKDAGINALVNLDCFANLALIPDVMLREIKEDYSAYLKKGNSGT